MGVSDERKRKTNVAEWSEVNSDISDYIFFKLFVFFFLNWHIYFYKYYFLFHIYIYIYMDLKKNLNTISRDEELVIWKNSFTV